MCRPWRRIRRASLTVECAAVLPIFFVVCLTVISFMHAIRRQAEQNLELSNRARALAIAANAAGESTGDLWIDLRKTVTFDYPFPSLGVPSLRIALRARVYPWVGSEEGVGGHGGDGDARGDDTIYLTDNESVYHTHSDCSHLDLTIIKTDMAGVRTLRNAYGRRYRRCRGFPRDYTGPVYVTAKGDYYYPSTEYASLTRHVRVAKREDHGELKECTRCAARDRRAAKHAA